jgi:chemotaxis signal transduction protein
MRSFVVFSCLNQLFGVDIECIQRILGAQHLTEIPDEEDHIEGMFKYEDEVLKVVSFRKLIGQISYEDQLRGLFPDLKSQHVDWVNALADCIETGSSFSKTTDPHACNLGKWIDAFHPDDKEVVETMKELNFHHQRLHHSAIEVLEVRDTCPEDAKALIENNVKEIYKNTLLNLEKVCDQSKKVATDMQQCLVLADKDNEVFGLNIDKVEEIIHVDESTLHTPQEAQKVGEFMQIEAILEFKGKLVTIINDIKVI